MSHMVSSGIRLSRKKDRIFSILFSLPALCISTIFMIFPMISAIYYSLTKWDGAGEKLFVGFENYLNLFNNPDFWTVMKNSLILVALHVCIQIPLAILLAYALYRTTQGFRFFRAVYFLPTVIAASVIALMVSLMFNADMGLVNQLLDTCGLGALKRNWLSDPNVVLYTVSLTLVLQYVGYHMAIILGGMQSISEDVIESAVIDGASSFEIFFRMVLPLIKNVLQISFLLAITGCLKAFDHSYIMTWGGPGVSSSYLAVYMYKTAYQQSDLGSGTAIAVVILILAFLFSKILALLFREQHPDKGGAIS